VTQLQQVLSKVMLEEMKKNQEQKVDPHLTQKMAEAECVMTRVHQSQFLEGFDEKVAKVLSLKTARKDSHPFRKKVDPKLKNLDDSFFCCSTI